MKTLFPCCPSCGTNLPLRRTQWNLGKPFACAACDAKLVIDRNYWLPFAGLLAFYAGRQRFGDGLHLVYLFLGIAAALFVVQMLTTKPELVESRPG